MRRSLALLASSALALAALTACNNNNDAPPAAAPAASGQVEQLGVVDTKTGSGAEAKPGMTVQVLYTGWLYDEHAPDKRGAKFDSTDDHGGTPFSFALGQGQVIKGWDQGVAGMHVGGERVEVAGAPGLRAVAAGVQFGIVVVQPHALPGDHAAQLQLQARFARQPRLGRAQLLEQGAADPAGADQAHGQRALAARVGQRHEARQREGFLGYCIGWCADVHGELSGGGPASSGVSVCTGPPRRGGPLRV